MTKPTICIDFDGVLHLYDTRWTGPAIISDPPVDGAMRFLWDASEHFTLAVFSSRSHQPGGLSAMRSWLRLHFLDHWAADRVRSEDILAEIQWPTVKPSAFLSIDDRALCFEGTWPSIPDLLAFKPWNKRETGYAPPPRIPEIYSVATDSMRPVTQDDIRALAAVNRAYGIMRARGLVPEDVHQEAVNAAKPS